MQHLSVRLNQRNAGSQHRCRFSYGRLRVATGWQHSRQFRDPVTLPVPPSTYLAIHAACAQVAHLSDPSEYIDKFNQDTEDGRILDPNGASAGFLEEAIPGLQIAGY